MLLEMRSSFLTNHQQPKAHKKIDRENMHKVEQGLRTSKPRREIQWFISQISDPPIEGSYVSVGCFQGSWAALNPFPTSLLDFFPCRSEITHSQTSCGTPWSLHAHQVTPCCLGDWIPKSNKCSENLLLWTRVLKVWNEDHRYSISTFNLSLNPNSLLFSNLK
jgi:hypothetical protein